LGIKVELRIETSEIDGENGEAWEVEKDFYEEQEYGDEKLDEK
jgi:hypothetical protein